MSKLLIDEHPLQVLPELAKRIGLNEAIVMQQIHYWNEISKKSNNNYRDGFYWTFNSINQWKEQFEFWSISTIKRTMKNLENSKLVISANYNKLKIDRTKWYRIDYNSLENLYKLPLVQFDTNKGSKWYEQLANLIQPLPETNSKTNSKNNKNIHITTEKNCNYVSILEKYENTTDLTNHISKHYKSDEVTEAIIYFYLFYYEKFNTKHSRLTDEQMIKVITTTDDCFYDGYISETNIKDTIELYFNEYVKERRKYYSMQEFFQLCNFVIWSARNM